MARFQTPTRRGFLSRIALGAGAALMPGFAGMRAEAASVGGYKALVCVFLYGGWDSHDVLLPYDQESHSAFMDLRAGIAPEATRGRSVLNPITPRNGDQFGARRFALPPEMPQLHQMFETGRAGIVANVGPLVRPYDRDDWRSGVGGRPPRLFSHNDQQSVWQANAPEGAQFGWGGLFADAALLSGANPNARAFTTISTTGDNLFLTGAQTTPFSVDRGGPTEIDYLARADRRRAWTGEAGEEIYQRLRRHFSAAQYQGNHLIEGDVAAILGRALENNETYAEALETEPALGTSFPDNDLGRQLRTIAQTIAVRSRLGAGRQIFFAGIGGFDTHSSQVQAMSGLLGGLDSALAAFQSAMDYLGEDQNVTTFTASDFGRTLAVNGDGTDHGWGAHHLVMGSAVRGGEIHGTPPPAQLDHSQDAGQGRMIPTVSVDQYAASLGRWFGLSETELSQALPNLANFQSRIDLIS